MGTSLVSQVPVDKLIYPAEAVYMKRVYSVRLYRTSYRSGHWLTIYFLRNETRHPVLFDQNSSFLKQQFLTKSFFFIHTLLFSPLFLNWLLNITVACQENHTSFNKHDFIDKYLHGRFLSFVRSFFCFFFFFLKENKFMFIFPGQLVFLTTVHRQFLFVREYIYVLFFCFFPGRLVLFATVRGSSGDGIVLQLPVRQTAALRPALYRGVQETVSGCW